MTTRLLLNLRDVPDDEIADVEALLDANGWPWYRTEPGRWGISAAAIWLRQADDFPAARAALDAYQAERGEQARADWARLQQEGRAPNLWSQLRAEPLATLAAWLAILLLLGMLALLPMTLLRDAG
ncbi:MAG: DUF6164 family protein [Lysobacterales bacterium]